MDKSDIEILIEELNNLSEFEKQNLARMKEIAKVLVDYYLPHRNDKKQGLTPLGKIK